MKRILGLLTITLFFTNCISEDVENKDVAKNCAQISVSDDKYINVSSDPFKIKDAEVVDGCLVLSIQYGGGCKEHFAELVAQEGTVGENPVERNLKVSFVDDDPCEALITGKWFFDLSSLKLENEDKIQLNIEGYPEPIIFTYHSPGT